MKEICVNARKWKVGGIFLSLAIHVSTPIFPPLLSDFAAPKVFTLFSFSWLHQIRSPAPLSLLLFLFLCSSFSLLPLLLHGSPPFSPKQYISL